MNSTITKTMPEREMLYIGKNELLALAEFLFNAMGFIRKYIASQHKPSLINTLSDHE